MEQIRVKAYAKVNLGLDVIRRRTDGYHEVKMIMQTIDLYDDLNISKTKDQKISITSNLKFLPVDENNLVYKAAKLFLDTCKISEGIAVDLKKHIPVAAGMAGGSSDAAAVLYGMNTLFQTGLTISRLMELGVKIGADVPYCLMQGTALAEGIGEKLTEIPSMIECPILVAKPGIHVSTAFVYGNLKLENIVHPDIDAQIAAIKAEDLKKTADCMGNVLESVTISKYPVVEEIKDCMKENGALNAMMSGSGPTVFGLFEDEKTAKTAYQTLCDQGLAKWVYLTGIHNERRR